MTPNMDNYLRRHGIRWSDIKYILRENGKTVIYLDDGRREETYNTVKSLLDVLPDEEFVCVNKGVVLARKKIVTVSGFTYTMNDGTEYIGRAHQNGGHMANIPDVISVSPSDRIVTPEAIFEMYKAMDNLPIAFCIIELCFNESGKGVDFIFRYSNKAMNEFSDIKGRSIINRSFYEVHPNADKSWLVPYTDVALNGNPRVIESRNTPGGEAAHLTVYCFQVAKNYCACMVVPTDN